MKKQRITPIAEPIQISQEAFTSSSLPNQESVNQAVAQVTGKPVTPVLLCNRRHLFMFSK